MRLKTDWASLIVGSKFTVFALFYFEFEGNFPSSSRLGAYIWRGDLTECFLRYVFGGLYLEGLIHGVAYKQLLDEVFVISGIIKVEVSVISRSRRLRLITLTETLIIPDITKTESNNCFIILYL